MFNKKIFQGTLTILLITIIVIGMQQKLFAQENAKTDTTNVLYLSLEELLNVDVTTASKSAEKQSDAPGIISILTKDELERFGGTTLKDVLERVPGLIGCSGFVDRSIITARGDQVKANSGHVLLLINGRPVRDVQGGMNSQIYETFPVNIIEKIEVIKGPGSVLYGSNAFSGVINIITEKAEKNSLDVTGLAGTGSAYGSSVGATIKSGDLNIVAAGRYLKKYEWKTGYNYIIFDPVTYIVTGPFTTNVTIPDKGPGAFFEASYKGLSVMSAYNDWTSGHFVSGATGLSVWKSIFSNLGYDMKVSEKWKMDLNITYTHTKMKSDSVVESAADHLVTEWTNSINLTNNSTLIFGGLYNYSSSLAKNLLVMDTLLPPPGTVVTDASVNGYGFYAQADYRLFEEKLKLIGGIQINKYDNIKINIVPRGGIIWHPVSKISIKALYSEAFKAPYIAELNYDLPPFFKGNPNLKPEKVGTIDIGINYQGDQVQAGVNYFNSKLTNIVVLTNGTYANLGKVDFQGFEIEGKYYINKSLYINGSALYQENESEIGKNVTPVANLGIKAGISYMCNKGATLSLFNIYQGDINEMYKNTLNTNQGAYNLLHLHSKFNLNKLFTMELKPEFSLFVNVDNLLDKKRYVYILGDSFPGVMPGNPGRAIYFGLNARF